MPRATVIAASCLVTALSAPTVGGQPERVHDAVRVVVLQGAPATAARDLLEGFRKRFDQLGRRVDLTVVDVASDGTARVGAPAPADLVVALGSRATAVAGSEYRGKPVIAALLARQPSTPDASVTASVVLEFPIDVELEWMRRILPNARRVGVLYSTEENARLVSRAKDVAKGLGFEIVARRVVAPSEIPGALTSLAGSADVLWGVPDEVVLAPETAKAVLLASLRNRVPFVGLSAQWVRVGAVYALDRDYADLGAQTADLALHVLDGPALKPNDAVRPRKVLYSLNVRSADMMRLTVPPDVIRGANEVVR